MRRRHWAKLTTATALAIILGSVPLRAETPVQTDATLGIPLPEQPELKLLDAERPASPQATAAHSGDASEAEIVTGTVSAGGRLRDPAKLDATAPVEAEQEPVTLDIPAIEMPAADPALVPASKSVEPAPTAPQT